MKELLLVAVGGAVSALTALLLSYVREQHRRTQRAEHLEDEERQRQHTLDDRLRAASTKAASDALNAVRRACEAMRRSRVTGGNKWKTATVEAVLVQSHGELHEYAVVLHDKKARERMEQLAGLIAYDETIALKHRDVEGWGMRGPRWLATVCLDTAKAVLGAVIRGEEQPESLGEFDDIMRRYAEKEAEMAKAEEEEEREEQERSKRAGVEPADPAR